MLLGRVLQAVKDGLRGKGFHLRSKEWPKVRKRHLEKEPRCQWCGCEEQLNVHHIKPFHLFPDLELDEDNLITLCEVKGSNDHCEIGHLGNFKHHNPIVRYQCVYQRLS